MKVGNSLALVIDRALLRVWNVTRMSRLEVSMEGGRLVISPVVGSGDPRPPSKRDALLVVHELQQLGFTQAHFDQIVPEPMRIGRYVTRLDGPGAAAPEIAVTMCRMAEVRRLLREGWKVRHAFAAAVASHPYEVPSGIETRFGDEAAERGAREDAARAEGDAAMREAVFEEEEREAQREAAEARARYA